MTLKNCVLSFSFYGGDSRIWSLCAFRSGTDFTGGLLPNASKILTTAGYKLRTEDGVLFLGPEAGRGEQEEEEDTLACESPLSSRRKT